MLAAAEANVDALVEPVVIKELNPGLGTGEPLGINWLTSS